jgi:SAM-dependent methyltransferase
MRNSAGREKLVNQPGHISRSSMMAALKSHDPITELRSHLDTCPECWNTWVDVRWQIAESHPDYPALQTFWQGPLRRPDASRELALEWTSQPRDTATAIREFYKQTPWYVPNLFVWAHSQQRPDYVDIATSVLQQYQASRIVDFGCGIGNDSIPLARAGYRVEALDLNRHCREFLCALVAAESSIQPLINVGEDLAQATDFDTLWAVDVVEHLTEPSEVLGPLVDRCRLVICDSEHTGVSNGRHPFHYPESIPNFESFLDSKGFVRLKGDTISSWARPSTLSPL